MLFAQQLHHYYHYYYYCHSASCLVPLIMQGTKLSTVERSMKDRPGPTPGRDQGSTRKEGTQIQGGKVNLEACPRDRTGLGAGAGWGDQRKPPGGGGAGPSSFFSRSQWWAGLGWGCRKVALWVNPSSCGQVILGLGAREMIPPKGQAWSRSGCFPCENAQRSSSLGVLGSSMNHSFLNLSKCVYKIKLRPRAAPGGAGR